MTDDKIPVTGLTLTRRIGLFKRAINHGLSYSHVVSVAGLSIAQMVIQVQILLIIRYCTGLSDTAGEVINIGLVDCKTKDMLMRYYYLYCSLSTGSGRKLQGQCSEPQQATRCGCNSG